MKLITHNFLTSKNIKGVLTGYPLTITATEIKLNEIDFSAEFITRVIPKLEWGAFFNAANSIGHGDGLPESLEPDYEQNEEFLRKVHHALMEVEIEEGHLSCPESGRQFPIRKGIPNMLLSENEINN